MTMTIYDRQKLCDPVPDARSVGNVETRKSTNERTTFEPVSTTTAYDRRSPLDEWLKREHIRAPFRFVAVRDWNKFLDRCLQSENRTLILLDMDIPNAQEVLDKVRSCVEHYPRQLSFICYGSGCGFEEETRALLTGASSYWSYGKGTGQLATSLLCAREGKSHFADEVLLHVIGTRSRIVER